YITKSKASNGADAYDLRALKRDAAGTFKAYSWGRSELVSIAGLSGPPVGLKAVDVNRDGLMDFLVFTGYGAPILLIGSDGQPPKPFTGSLGPMAAATPAGLSLMDLNGPALIVTQNTFARHIQLDSKGQWEIKTQFNSGRNSAVIQGAAALDADGDGKKEIVLL